MRLGFTGRGRVRVFDEDGTLIHEGFFTNFITEAGEALAADRLTDRDDSGGDLSHMAIGDSTGQTRASTTLANEVARVALTTLDQGTGGDDNDMLFTATFGSGVPAGGATITEGAIFNEASGGTMFNYYEFDPAIVKGSTQSVTIDMTITCGNS